MPHARHIPKIITTASAVRYRWQKLFCFHNEHFPILVVLLLVLDGKE